VTEELKPGLFEDLVSQGLRIELENLPESLVAETDQVDDRNIPAVLSQYVSRVLLDALKSIDIERRGAVGTATVNALISNLIREFGDVLDEHSVLESEPKMLRQVSRLLPDGSAEAIERPLVALGDTVLFTNFGGEPQLFHQLQSEIDSADSIDILMAFVTWSGVRGLLGRMKKFIESGRSIRLMTTVYRCVTEKKALDELTKIGVQIKVSYDTERTRLHAKAWLFERQRLLSSAYIGSSNLTNSATSLGAEWNVRISESLNADVVEKFRVVFESYWERAEYRDYDPTEFAAAVDRGKESREGYDITWSPIPFPFQTVMLESLEASRSCGLHKNLVVAATGTGKTVTSAFDYRQLVDRMGSASLLFVAHRKEILDQSRQTFGTILRDSSFGELWVDGEKPTKFSHVFASVQTLSAQSIETFDPHAFDVIIIDEAHHVAAPTYQSILRHLRPRELVGLTATPERGDGHDILQYFDGRIAAELRLWEAIEQQLLTPFDYLQINDGLDLTAVKWRRGSGYDVEELTNLYTAQKQWISLVLRQIHEQVLDPFSMRALGFCVSVKHAEFVAKQFNEAGIRSIALKGENESVERSRAIRMLQTGEIQAIFTVDIFNEGIDIPSVDTLLLMRPTDSGLLFLQQIGRGLRRCDGKQLCTILDFIGHQRAEFRFENRFQALIGGTRQEIQRQVESGFKFLPAGCRIQLDRVSQAEVLENLRNSIPSRKDKMVAELRSLGDVSLRDFLRESGLVLADLYTKGVSFAELRRLAGFDTSAPTDEESALIRGVLRLDHLDDLTRISRYQGWLQEMNPPQVGELTNFDRRLARMMSSIVTYSHRLNDAQAELDLIWKYPAVRSELKSLIKEVSTVVDHRHPEHVLQKDVPLRIHALYRRAEIQAALDDVINGQISDFREGVRYVEPLKTDIFLFTMDKSPTSFTVTTRYKDYAISEDLIHWESQSKTKSDSKVAQRYINHSSNGTTVLLFGRQRVTDNAYWFLGPAQYVSHSGERPVAFKWKLDHRLPAALFRVLGLLAA